MNLKDKRRKVPATVFLSVMLILFAASTTSFSQQKKSRHYILYSVTRVIDGDTFWVEDSFGKQQKVRLIGVDAPEPRNAGQKVKSYYGKEASEYLKRLIGGRKVRLEYDIGHHDRYNRTLAYVYLENGTFVNAEMVKNGYAMVMTVPPNVKYASIFVKLERKARNEEKGLWGEMRKSKLQRSKGKRILS